MAQNFIAVRVRHFSAVEAVQPHVDSFGPPPLLWGHSPSIRSLPVLCPSQTLEALGHLDGPLRGGVVDPRKYLHSAHMLPRSSHALNGISHSTHHE